MSGLPETFGAWPAVYVLLLSAGDFFLMGLDKVRSRHKGARRVPERTLFLLAFLGGAPGAICGMLAFRHKTRHWYFTMGMPAILTVQIVSLALLNKK